MLGVQFVMASMERHRTLLSLRTELHCVTVFSPLPAVVIILRRASVPAPTLAFCHTTEHQYGMDIACLLVCE